MEFAIHPVAGDLHLPAVCRGDREALAKHRHQGFLDRRDDLVALFDLEGRMDVRERLVDLVELVARGVLEEQRAPHCQELAVHLEGVVPVRIVDPQIAGHRDQLLVQNERLAGWVLAGGTGSGCRSYERRRSRNAGSGSHPRSDGGAATDTELGIVSQGAATLCAEYRQGPPLADGQSNATPVCAAGNADLPRVASWRIGRTGAGG